MKYLDTAAGSLPLPAFFPDATYGAIRAGTFEDVYRAELYGCEMNSYHLMNKPKVTVTLPNKRMPKDTAWNDFDICPVLED